MSELCKCCGQDVPQDSEHTVWGALAFIVAGALIADLFAPRR